MIMDCQTGRKPSWYEISWRLRTYGSPWTSLKDMQGLLFTIQYRSVFDLVLAIENIYYIKRFIYILYMYVHTYIISVYYIVFIIEKYEFMDIIIKSSTGYQIEWEFVNNMLFALKLRKSVRDWVGNA